MSTQSDWRAIGSHPEGYPTEELHRAMDQIAHLRGGRSQIALAATRAGARIQAVIYARLRLLPGCRA